MLLDQPVDGIQRQNPASIHDRHAVTQSFGLFHVVGRVQHRSALFCESLDVLENVVPGLRIDPDRRLIQEQNGRVVNQRAGHVKPALHAAGISFDPAPSVFDQPGEFEPRLDALAQARPAKPIECPEEGKIFLAGQFAVERKRLGRDTDAPSRFGPGRVRGSVDLDLARVGLEGSDQQVNRRGLAGSVRP